MSDSVLSALIAVDRAEIANLEAQGGPGLVWEFPKIRGTFLGGPYNKDPTI